MKYLVTGHTGFKGSWLSLWLAQQGHEVDGLSLQAERGSLFQRAELSTVMHRDFDVDIRDAAATARAVRLSKPDVLIHMAAQATVPLSYTEPALTMETNVMGTMNVLDAALRLTPVPVVLVITSDKVYLQRGLSRGFTEDDPLGGADPYSASKAMAEILTGAWVSSFAAPGQRIATARAGNVIGGCDHNSGRIVPDIIAALEHGTELHLRNPDSIRPWQHVLDIVNGYTQLIDAMAGGGVSGGAWNFGPPPDSWQPVRRLVEIAQQRDGGPQWDERPESFGESAVLTLDAAKSHAELGWRNILSLEQAMDWTLQWHDNVRSGVSPIDATLAQINTFELLS